MATALVRNRTYAPDYGSFTDKSNYLVGNVWDVIEEVIDFDVEITSESSYALIYTITGTDTITRPTGSFYKDGIVVGAVLTITANSGAITATATVLTVSPSIITLNVTAGSLVDGDYPNTGVTNTAILLVSDSGIQGVEFAIALIENTNYTSGSLDSLIDGSTSNFKYNQVDTLGVGASADLVPQGFQSGHNIISAEIKYIGSLGSTKQYQITTRFNITPIWEDLADLANEVRPSYFFNTECITDSIFVQFFPEAGDPNRVIVPDLSNTALLGNTGWFNENRNGSGNNFNVNSLSFFNAASLPITDIQSKAETSFTMSVKHVGGTALSEYKYNFFLTPDDTTIYSDNNYSLGSNLTLCESDIFTTASPSILFQGTANSAGARMDVRLESAVRVGDDVIIKGVFIPNTDFGTYIDAIGATNLNYSMSVSAGDENLSWALSDRVNLLARYGELITSSTNVQSFNVTNSFLEHPQPASQVGVSFYEGAVEDEVLARSIIKVDTAAGETIEEATFTIEGYNSVTQERYTLESNSYNTSIYPADALGIQQINIDETRGFQMAPGVDKNEVKVFRSPIDDVGTLLGYRSLYAFRFRWEDWIQNLNVHPDFWDNTKLNDGLNEDWADKESLANWRLTYNVRLKVNRGGTIINTRNSFDFSVRDYEESTIYDGEITTYNEPKTTPLFLGLNPDGIRENSILKAANTWIEADFDLEDIFGDVGDINDYYGVIRIEEYRNGGIFAIDMLSTVLTNETTNNLLLPLTGETACKITKVSLTKIRLECYIDYTKVNTSVRQYKISARLGCADINAGKYSKHYSLKYN